MADEPDAACQCPPPPTVDSSTVNRVPYTVMLDPGNRYGQGVYCDEDGIALSGGCTFPDEDPRVHIMYNGDIGIPEYPQFWSCGWFNYTQEWHDFTTTITCLNPPSAPDNANECNCTEYEPIADRITSITRSEPYQGYSTNEITIECPASSVFLSGGCAFQGLLSTAADSMTLSRSGFTNKEATTWGCGWNTPVQTDGELMLVTAYCLQPPTYGPDSLEGRITRVIESQTVPANGYASFTASCPPGDYLLSGSCMLDSIDPDSHRAIMYHHGLDVTDPNTWRCAWNNPTALTIPATAIATCVTSSAQ